MRTALSRDIHERSGLMRQLILALALLLLPIDAAYAGDPAKTATLYKNPQCGCCEGYAAYLRENGFTVSVKPTHELVAMSREAGIPEDFHGCHLSFIDGYVVSGHVPVDTGQSIVERAARHQGHHAPRHADGFARDERREDGALHGLRDLRRRARGLRG